MPDSPLLGCPDPTDHALVLPLLLYFLGPLMEVLIVPGQMRMDPDFWKPVTLEIKKLYPFYIARLYSTLPRVMKKLKPLISLSLKGAPFCFYQTEVIASGFMFSVLYMFCELAYVYKNHSSREIQNYSCSYSGTRKAVLTLIPDEYIFFRVYST